MEPIEVTNRRVLAIWWLLVWRGMVFGFLAGFVAGFIVGFVLGILRVDLVASNLASTLAGFLAGGCIGFLVLRNALKKKRFKDFRIVLVPLENKPAGIVGA